MTTFAVMKSRIADELARTDLTSQISAAILSAVAHWERERFFWNEKTATFSLVVGQEYYTSSDLADIPNLIEIDSLLLTASGLTYPLDERDFQYMEELNNSTTFRADPTDYCYYKQQLRLGPVPNQVRTMTMAYVYRLTALSADSDSNAWTVTAEELIRTWAKIDLFENVIRDFAEADRLRLRMYEDEGILSRLRGETLKRMSPGRLRPTLF